MPAFAPVERPDEVDFDELDCPATAVGLVDPLVTCVPDSVADAAMVVGFALVLVGNRPMSLEATTPSPLRKMPRRSAQQEASSSQQKEPSVQLVARGRRPVSVSVVQDLSVD